MDGFGDCDGDESNGCETDLTANDRSCGACGVGCSVVEECGASTCSTIASPPTSLRILTMSDESCVITGHDATTGDDNGGIAAAPNRFYYTGDDNGGRFVTTDPDMQTRVTKQEGIFSDIFTGQLYAFTAGGTPVDGCDTIDGFVTLDANLDVVGTPTALSMSLDACLGTGDEGVFAGFGFVILWIGGNAMEIDLATGTVTDLGAVALDSPRSCESWAFWGFAERHGGTTFLVYTTNDTVTRTEVGTDTHSIIVDIGDTDDMCSISVDLAASRWVFHYESDGWLSGPEETAGSCPMTFDHP